VFEGKRGPGRPPGSKNKRTLEGETYAQDILVQDEAELVRDPETGRVLRDIHPRALADPVFRGLRAQARAGVGNVSGCLPPAALVSFADRAWGKVTDKIKMQQSTARAFAGETDEELAVRAASLAKDLGLVNREAN